LRHFAQPFSRSRAPTPTAIGRDDAGRGGLARLYPWRSFCLFRLDSAPKRGRGRAGQAEAVCAALWNDSAARCAGPGAGEDELARQRRFAPRVFVTMPPPAAAPIGAPAPPPAITVAPPPLGAMRQEGAPPVGRGAYYGAERYERPEHRLRRGETGHSIPALADQA
jgi:hypothetical protein